MFNLDIANVWNYYLLKHFQMAYFSDCYSLILQSNWREIHLFKMERTLAMYMKYGSVILSMIHNIWHPWSKA